MRSIVLVMFTVLLQLCTTVGDVGRGLPARGSTWKPGCSQLLHHGDGDGGGYARSSAVQGPEGISKVLSLRGGTQVGADVEEEDASLMPRADNVPGEDLETHTQMRAREGQGAAAAEDGQRPTTRACDVWEIITGPGKPNHTDDYNYTVFRNRATGAAVEFVHVEDERPVVGFFRFLSADILDYTPDYEIDKDMWRDCVGHACFVNGHHTGDFLQAVTRPSSPTHPASQLASHHSLCLRCTSMHLKTPSHPRRPPQEHHATRGFFWKFIFHYPACRQPLDLSQTLASPIISTAFSRTPHPAHAAP